MTPESFNAALATRKLEAIDILLIQANRGSDADRIRAASAILRIAFIPIVASASSRCAAKPPLAPQAEGLQVHSRGQSNESARSAAPAEPPISSPSPPGSYSAAPGNPTASTLRAAAGTAPTPAPTPSPSTPINFSTPPHTDAHPLPMDPAHHPTFPPRGLIITPNSAHPFPPQTPTSLATPIITYEHQHQFSSA